MSLEGRRSYDVNIGYINNVNVYFGRFALITEEIHHFPYIFDPSLRWIDYYAIHQMDRAHGKVTVIFYCEDINSPYIIWSPWIKLLFFQYVPQMPSLSASTPFWFIFSLQHEFAEGALAYSVFQFDLVWKGSQFNIIQYIGEEELII